MTILHLIMFHKSRITKWTCLQMTILHLTMFHNSRTTKSTCLQMTILCLIMFHNSRTTKWTCLQMTILCLIMFHNSRTTKWTLSKSIQMLRLSFAIIGSLNSPILGQFTRTDWCWKLKTHFDVTNKNNNASFEDLDIHYH